MATLGALLWDFNPRSPHRERPCGNGFSGDDLAISIHAPLTGSDDWQAETSKSSAISIHAPLTGSDDWRQVRRIRWNISIHAPLTGSDLRNLSIFNRIPNFNPRSPHRERPSLLFRCPNLPYFNPRSPHRERRLSVTIHVHNKVFQSTLPSQGATGLETGEYIVKQISIHAPLTGSDGHEVQMVWRRSYFNPRSPHRERLSPHTDSMAEIRISIHAPLTGSDDLACKGQGTFTYFNPRSPHRERPWQQLTVSWQWQFQSTLPSQGATANIHIKFLCDLLFSTLSSKISLLFRVFHR